ncbi:hypothetical protein [Mesorhizobium sp. LNJC405B00]|uniref:hypothetical protein n=1 Tax=unclassified Mesorhizobium TaxID=325217 RepID=UPI0003CE671B|nr:hypothetical protein [Mesorhizobium sp. LNJC405B00]ESY01336.1 hypothetical protein X755_06400 [Mesorhizobium sp. LNJC405B00]
MATFYSTFGGQLSQAELDFVDVDTAFDNPLYLDPYAIQIRNDEWSATCGDHIRSFFAEVLEALRDDNPARAGHLLGNLHEPNETCFGQSVGEPAGRGVGHGKALDLVEALRHSRAFGTGVLADISEAELFIRGVGPDTISDLTTNILRGLLADYTKDQCDLLGIPTRTLPLDPCWSAERQDWVSRFYELPISNGKPILLVPKFSVRRTLSLNSQEFWNHYMIEFLRQEYLDARSSLVRTFRDGVRYVTKKSVKERHPLIKDDLATFVQRHPEVLEEYKRIKGAQGPLDNDDLDANFDETVFARVLIDRLAGIATGNNTASEYHRVAMGITTFLFFPSLIKPIKEQEIHEGRKRMDIKFTNAAQIGFFFRMLQAPQTRSISVPVECKNYSNDVENPELDQLTGRFGLQRGFFGMMLCRRLDERPRVVAACRDAAGDGRGYMLVLEDADLVQMLEMVERHRRPDIDTFLQRRFDEITH